MTYTLHHGDCLDILPTLPAQSVDAIIALSQVGVIVPFPFEMARMTEANQITQGICLFGRVEGRKSSDVVYVKLLAEFLLSNAARLTGVIVSLAGASALTLPVSTVIGDVTTAPSGIVRATAPSVSALGRTEAEAPCSLECSSNNNMLTAVLAIVFDCFLFGWAGCNKSRFSSLLIAFSRAHDHELGAYLKRLSLKYLAAYLAGVRVVIFFLCSTQLIGALAAASGLPTPFKAFRVGKIGFVTNGACAFNHVHNYSMTLG